MDTYGGEFVDVDENLTISFTVDEITGPLVGLKYTDSLTFTFTPFFSEVSPD